ncbi:two-component system response regulator CreB [Motiliproteus sp. MSK22-1]|uniref:two-component system response regulator CreB n=1 Tax=Motiliproteus sp. MSK22-1 TaxID=1897630 RepID=UPI000975D63E|nr:two-component system response regulator CreB [Motiliproteus sp. MSK22-1]OMH31716.1 two-component system response regulator CreB [Motiliproteus sp. MSK22-1]
MKVLIVEDEQGIADNIIYALKQEGFSVEHILLGHQCISRLRSQLFDMVILDVGLPDIGGFEVCKQIRTFSEIPIIFLTARDHEIDRVVGLEIGADDYVTKPFSPRELVARVKVILKRLSPRKHVPIADEAEQQTSALFRLLEEQKKIEYCGLSLDLTRYEFGLLQTLLAQPERVFSREQLMQSVWPDSYASFDRVVDTHIKGLRAKLKQVNSELDPIKTHRGLGYSLCLNGGGGNTKKPVPVSESNSSTKR